LKRGLAYGRTDDFGYNIVENAVHVHDLQATILHLLGLDHERLTFRHARPRLPAHGCWRESVNEIIA